MAEENKPSEFSQTPPELSEKEKIQARISQYQVGMKPQTAQIVNAILESQLKNGLVKLPDLEAIIDVRNTVTSGLEGYQQAVQVATQRLQEIETEEAIEKQAELDRRESLTKEKLIAERQRRKQLEDRVEELLKQIHGESPDTNQTLTPPPDPMESWEKWTPPPIKEEPTLQPPKPKSKAWDMVRATRPDTVEIEKENISTEVGKSLDDVTPEEWDAVTKSFSTENVVPFPNEPEGYTDEPLLDGPEFEITERISDEDYEDTLPDLEDIKGLEEFQVQEEDTETEPNFTKPVVSASNAPNIKAVVEEPKNVEAKVDQPIPSYDSEEELLAAAQAKIDAQQEEEEETVEIVIPSRSDLESLTKSKIKDEGDKLDFELSTSDTKAVMIDSFVEQSEKLIQELTEEDGFVSATETTEGDDNVDRRDGGYF